MGFLFFKYTHTVGPQNYKYSELPDFRAISVKTFLDGVGTQLAQKLAVDWTDMPDSNPPTDAVLSTEGAVATMKEIEAIRVALWSLVRTAQLSGDHASLPQLSIIYSAIFGVTIPFSEIAQIPVKPNEANT